MSVMLVTGMSCGSNSDHVWSLAAPRNTMINAQTISLELTLYKALNLFHNISCGTCHVENVTNIKFQFSLMEQNLSACLK